MILCHVFGYSISHAQKHKNNHNFRLVKSRHGAGLLAMLGGMHYGRDHKMPGIVARN